MAEKTEIRSDGLGGFDIAIVGAGIVGLAHALAAARRGLSVALFDRDHRANGASIRNFGFVTVTGQRRGRTWQRARFSRDVWDRVAPAAGIPILQKGLTVSVRHPESLDVLSDFMATEMGADCRLLGKDEAARFLPMAPSDQIGSLYSPHERRVEPRTAIPKLAAWLEASYPVRIFRGVAVRGVETGRIHSSVGQISASRIVVCPGADLVTLFPDWLAGYKLKLCKLQMLRLAAPGWDLPSAVMGDLSLVRYDGYSALPAAAALRRVLDRTAHDALADGIHLIVVQSADGSLVVGDSHSYDDTPDPFVPASVEKIILREAAALLALPSHLPVIERWIGLYPSSASETAILDLISPGIGLCVVSSGTGMSTAFALGEEGIAKLLSEPDPLAAQA